MVKRRLKAVLALVVAMMLALQAPMYTFAEQASGDTSVESEQTSSRTADNQDESELNYVIGEDGNQVDLTDEMRDEIYSEDSTEEDTSGLYKVDTDAFFDYDESEVQAASGDVIYQESFDSYAEGATAVEGLTFRTVLASGKNRTSTVAVGSDSKKGKVLRMTKNKNGATNGSKDKESGGESVYAVHQFDAPLQGNYSVSAEVKIEQIGRIGMFLYGKNDAGIESMLDNKKIPYLGRMYFWDTGKNKENPTDNKPDGICVWTQADETGTGDAKIQEKKEKKVAYTKNTWYNVTFSFDTAEQSYTITIADMDGNVLYEDSTLRFNSTNAGESGGMVYGFGLHVQDDIKSLGTVAVKNITVTDDAAITADKNSVVADKNALSLPKDFDATKVIEDFTMPIAGDNHSTISYTSSDENIIQIDNQTGVVKVTRPDFNGSSAVSVRLTANIAKGEVQATKEFILSVIPNSPASDKEIVRVEKDLLVIPSDVNTFHVEDNFVLPVVGQFGSTITYTSSNDAIARVDSETGLVTITKPLFTGALTQNVVLTAVISSGSEKETKEFSIDVSESDPKTDAEKALYDAETALVGGVDLSNVKQENFYLSDKGSYGSLTWESSNSDYISISKNFDTEEGPNEDGEGNQDVTSKQDGFKAIVTKPDSDDESVVVTLTVTANVNGQTATKTFDLTITPSENIKAYPGVEGYGSYSKGGRGGQVYHVTNLNHDGKGSLTYGLEQVQGARTIVFDVGGVIDLTDLGRPIAIKGEKYSNVTVAGQTAPYPGITLKGYGLSVGSAHDVIIRNIKIRIGDVVADGEFIQSDPLSVSASKQVIIDHCTTQWAIDMNFRITGEHITVSNTMFGKPLAANTSHEKGSHSYVGMINEGARKVSFLKNLISNSDQRSPRITDADYVDAYNNLIFDCKSGFDICNYEWQDKIVKMNIHNNMARKGPSFDNTAPYRAFRGRNYSGGVMVYFDENYGIKNSADLQKEVTGQAASVAHTLTFGKENNLPRTDYDLRNVTYREWLNNPASYDNDNKSTIAATITYMTYPFPAPRGDIMDVWAEGVSPTTKVSGNNIIEYALDENGMGATRPARDLYDTMIFKEVEAGTGKNIEISEEDVEAFFVELEKRTGIDYHNYVREDGKVVDFTTKRSWTAHKGEGPVLKGATTAQGHTKPVHWDDYTDVNKNTYDGVTSKYNSESITTFEVNDWWGEFCGAPGQQATYNLYDNLLNRPVKTTDPNYDQTRYSLDGVSKDYIEVQHTVADLEPPSWMYESDGTTIKPEYEAAAAAMDSFRKTHYSGKATTYKIPWDGMGDGIPNWFKQYKGWSTSQYLASAVDEETGYTYLELYLQFMAGDEPLDAEDDPASIENFNANNIGYSTAKIYWNTDFRTACVIEYGTQPGVYSNSVALDYESDGTDDMHTYHEVDLTALKPNTQYYYKITAVDENGQQTTAEYTPDTTSEQSKMTFTTTPSTDQIKDLPAQPIITNDVPYLGQVRLNWTGNVATDESYEIYYDTTDHGSEYAAYANKITGLDIATNKQTIKDLENGTTYYFIVVAVNQNGKTASEVIASTPSGTLFDYNFPTMTQAEIKRFINNNYMYVLGGQISVEKDPDTGENVLQMYDATGSHGVNSDIKLPVTQESKFSYEVRLKMLYQKQWDALNHQEGMTGEQQPDRNTFQINFGQDPYMNEDKDSTNTPLWESAISCQFEAASTPISIASNGRFDGTTEHGDIMFQSIDIGDYSLGTTPGKDVSSANKSFPVNVNHKSYTKTSAYGDAIYDSASKTSEAMWYYQLGSTKFVTYKFVIDPIANNITVYADGEVLYAAGEFNEDIGEPYNIGRVQLKTRNPGYCWVNVESIRLYSGDGSGSNSTVKPVGPGITNGVGNNYTGGGGGGVTTPANPTAAPQATEDPNATQNPDATQAPATDPVDSETNKYFDDLGSVAWAAESINKLAENGIITGTGDRQFSPASNVTRAEFVTMLMRAYGSDVTAAAVQFNDAAEGEWYYEPIAKAVALGVANGYDNGNFGINDNISREDMMVMAYRTMNAIGITIPKSKDYQTFGDQNSISDYAAEAVEAMYCADIINGVGDNMLNPKGEADRAQSAKIIYGLINMEGTVNE